MRRIKYTVFCLLTILSLYFCLNCASAKEQADVILSLQLDNPIMQVNGTDAEIDPGRGTKPVAINGRTLIPIRAIIEAFGGSVGWEDATQSVVLTMKDNTIRLFIDSNDAYLNNRKHTLDVAPTAINGRTMLPIRFIAESFNLGVAWDGETQTVTIIRDTFTDDEYNYLMSILPVYNGQAYQRINNNTPFFEEYEIINGSFEYYSDLDSLGRCDVCFASVSTDLMPTEDRESISSVIPTGWVNKSYDNVSGGYLYNRCHLIGFQLTGENANKRNLITGTRYLNIEGMLPFENEIADYIEETGNNVMYRSTPVFEEENLVAHGVLLEVYSVEDNGKGITFCVYCYNVQPDIRIDYATGENSLESSSNIQISHIQDKNQSVVYRTSGGKRYHFDPDCGGKNSFAVSMVQAINAGLTPCAKCTD